MFVKYALKILGIYLAFLAQSLVFENIKILSCSPDILVVAIIMCSVSAGTLQAALLGLVAGLFADALYGSVFGINILVYMYLAIAVSVSVQESVDNSPLIMSWVTFASVTVLEIILTLFKSMFGFSVSVGFLGANILVKGGFGALFTLLFVLIYHSIKKSGTKSADSGKEETA